MNQSQKKANQQTAAGADDCHVQRIAVPFEYPVCFTHDVLSVANPLLAESIDRLHEGRKHRVQVFVDAGLDAARPGVARGAADYLKANSERLELVGEPILVAGGERAKDGFEVARGVMTAIAQAHLDRQSFVVAIGGGGFLDVVGLAAALVHRGVRLVRIPTTVLAQDDAGVGVKNGINDHGVKNFAGTFAPPFAVLIDFDFLSTLDDQHFIGGMAEAFKVAIIEDADFFKYLCENAKAIQAREPLVVETVIRRCALLHLEHIRAAGDPFEFGSARPLDFGHWSAHRLEMLSGHTIGHGQAVAVGIALDSCYACECGLIGPVEREAILDGLERTGLPTWDEMLIRRSPPGGRLDVLQGLDDFREHLGGRLNVTLPNPVGQKIEVHEMDAIVIERCIGILRQRAENNATGRTRVGDGRP